MISSASARLARVPLFFSAVRFQETLFALPFAYTGMVLAAEGLPTWHQFGWITAAMVGARTLGMAANRLIDRHIDARNPRTASRHLPTGALASADVAVLAAVAAAVFFVSAAMLNGLALALSPVAAAYLIAYPYTKRFTWAANLLLGWALAIAPAGAWIGVRGQPRLGRPSCSRLAVACWAGGFDVLYHVQDRDFYVRDGLHSARPEVRRRGRVQGRAGSRRRGRRRARRARHRGWAWPYRTSSAAPSPRRSWAYKYRIVSPADLSRMGVAFMRMNALVSATMLLSTLIAVLVDWGEHPGEQREQDRPVIVRDHGRQRRRPGPRRTIDRLLEADRPVVASASPAARMVWRQEIEESFGSAIERLGRLRRLHLLPERRPDRAHSQRHLPGPRHGHRPPPA